MGTKTTETWEDVREIQKRKVVWECVTCGFKSESIASYEESPKIQKLMNRLIADHLFDYKEHCVKLVIEDHEWVTVKKLASHEQKEKGQQG